MDGGGVVDSVGDVAVVGVVVVGVAVTVGAGVTVTVGAGVVVMGVVLTGGGRGGCVVEVVDLEKMLDYCCLLYSLICFINIYPLSWWVSRTMG